MSCIISTFAIRRRSTIFALAILAATGAACSKDDPTTPEQLLSRGNEAFAAHRLFDAEKAYREVLRLRPDEPVAQRQLGLIYFEQGQVREAYELLKKSSELEPENVDAQLKLALLFYASRDFQKARALVRQILEKNPGNRDALILMVDTATTPADVQEARNFVEKLKDRPGDQLIYHLVRGAIELHQKDDIQAEAEFKAALSLDPKSSEVYVALGNLYLGRQDIKAATQAYETAATLSPLRSPIRLRYAQLKLQNGATDEARKLADEIVSAAPDYLPARVFRMTLACNEKRDDDCAARVANILEQNPLNYDALLQKGIISLNKGEAIEAVRIFEQLSSMNSQDARVRFQLAAAYLLYAKNAPPEDARKAVEGAEFRLGEAVKLAPRFEQAIMLLTELKIRKGNAAAAIDLIAPLVKERPQLVQAYYLLATAYLAQQQPDKALAVYRQMTELFPNEVQPRFLLGTILLTQQRPSEARQALEKSLEIAPDYLPAVEALVNLDINQKQYAKATERAQQRIDKDPKSAQGWALRGKSYLAQRNFAQAEADMLKALELDPKSEPIHLLLAQIYVAANKQDQAIEKLNAVLKDNSNDAAALLQLASIHQALNHVAEARDAYEKLLTISPNFVLALNNLAILYSEQLGDLNKAYELATKARDLSSNDPTIADTVGWILYKRGQYRDALALLRESVSKRPDSSILQFHLGMTNYMLGDEESARLALQKVADASPDFPEKKEARQRLALLAIDARTGDANARSELDNYLRGSPNDPAALMRLGQMQERDNALDQAANTYQKIVDANPYFAPATTRLALLSAQRSPDDPKTFDLVTKARDIKPDDPEIVKALGILNYRRNYYPQAAELLKKAAATRTDDPELLYYLGQTYRQLQQWDDCKSALANAIDLKLSANLTDQAKNALADCSDTRRLALLYSQRSPDDPKTYEMVTKARQANPDDLEIAKTLGILTYRRGDYQQSAQLLKETAAKRNDDAELLYYLGQAYRGLNQRDECKVTLERALNLNLSPNLTDQAKSALAICSEKSPS